MRVSNSLTLLLASFTFATGFLLAQTGRAQNASAKGWDEKKAERLKPVTEAQQMSIVAAVPESATAMPKSNRRVLVFYRCEGFIHTSIPHGNLATEQMGRQTGAFQVDVADSYDVFTAENLARYDAIVLNNTTHLKFPEPEQEKALLEFVAGGKGLVGYHAASDNFYAHPEAAAMIGGQFNGHPWGAGGTWAFKLDDADHVLNRAFKGDGFWHQDEIYQYLPDTYQGPEVLRLLVSLDMKQSEVTDRIKDDGGKGGYAPGPREVPVSWVRSYGKGRVFVTNFGHREETFWNPAMLRHMLDGIQFALGDLEADTTPTAARDGWKSLFDGSTLEGWTQKGGPAHFEAVDGMIVGTTGEGVPNAFLTRGPYGDFELRFEVKCDPKLNSGVQIRSHVYPVDTPQESMPSRIREAGEVYGYQCEIRGEANGPHGCSGNFWDEGRRTVWLDEAVDATEKQKAYRAGEWNDFRIIAQGQRIQSFVNGVKVADFTDDRDSSGFIGLQVHSIRPGTGPYQVAWRNLQLRELSADETIAD